MVCQSLVSVFQRLSFRSYGQQQLQDDCREAHDERLHDTGLGTNMTGNAFGPARPRALAFMSVSVGMVLM
jgi:hypothetical protein